MSVKQFEDFDIWRLSRNLVNKIYDINFKSSFGLANQIQRASVSIMSNIAEGFERDGNQEFIQFLYIAKGSCGEVRSQLYIAYDRNYINGSQLKEFGELAKVISMKIWGLIKHLKECGMKGIKYKVHNPMDKYQEELLKIFNEVNK